MGTSLTVESGPGYKITRVSRPVEFPRIQGIYAIVNIVNGLAYIGSSVHILDRYWGHVKSLNRGKHENIFLQRAWDKYESHCFVLEIAEEVANRQHLKEREQVWLEAFGYYNIAKKSDRPPSAEGRIWREETLEKLRVAQLGRTRSESWRENQRLSHLGKTHPEETKQKIRDASIRNNSVQYLEEFRATLTKEDWLAIGQKSLGARLAKQTPEKLEKARSNIIKVAAKYAYTPEVLAKRGATWSKNYWEKKRRESGDYL